MRPMSQFLQKYKNINQDIPLRILNATTIL